MTFTNCCISPNPRHKLDEMGSAHETFCANCRTVLATIFYNDTGRRRWRMRNGRTNEHGITAERPALSHTCKVSTLPCPACVRDKHGRHASLVMRDMLGEYRHFAGQVGFPS